MVLSLALWQGRFSNSTHTVTESVCACKAGGMVHSMVSSVFLRNEVNIVTAHLAMSTSAQTQKSFHLDLMFCLLQFGRCSYKHSFEIHYKTIATCRAADFTLGLEVDFSKKKRN